MDAKRLALHGGTPVRSQPFPAWPVHDETEEAALLRVVRSGHWWRVRGGEVESFERAFAEYHGARYGIAVTSGTVALRIALLAAGLKAGDEVIVPPYTFMATASSVVECNGTPVFVDIESDTYNLDPALVEAAITPRTRAILPVHFAGRAAAMDELMEIARRHDLIVIEDAAHAHGGALNGRGIGSIGHMGCFSFQASKNLNAGEGGIVITNDEALAEECRSIHNFGRRPGGAWYEHEVMSGNYRMTEFQGAILNAQLARLSDQTDRREANAARLTKRLRDLPGIEPQVRIDAETKKAYHLYLFRFDESIWGMSRPEFVDAMNAEGIPVTGGYPVPLYKQPVFTGPDFGPFTGAFEANPGLDYRNAYCPVAERACASEGAWMLHNVLLGTERDVDDIADAFEKVYDARSTTGLGVQARISAGFARIDITPPVGFELAGFVAREQPSVGVHDPLFMRAMFLEHEGVRLAWLHADIIAFGEPLVAKIRSRLAQTYGLRAEEVFLSASHTHAGPPTLDLAGCGSLREGQRHYLDELVDQAVEAVSQAKADLQPVQVCIGEDKCDISFDRRGKASAHVDQRVAVIGFRRTDRSWHGVLANYAVHPVSMGHGNRYISGDLHGIAAGALEDRMDRTVLMTNGACANVNPPRAGTDFAMCESLAADVAAAVGRAIASSYPVRGELAVRATSISIQPERLSEVELATIEAERRAETDAMDAATRARANCAIDGWLTMMRTPAATSPFEMPIHAVRIGPMVFVGFGAEVFSIMGDRLRESIGPDTYVVGYANGNIGYVAPEAAYDEGGYEVGSAAQYYMRPPIPRGAFEKACEVATELCRSLDAVAVS
jgi:dTDP-4-amino-4,6-dideoxygalactose transaminase